MNGHPFAVQRFEQANRNIAALKNALNTGDLHQFIDITEGEAMSLHALMMTSQPRFMLMQPQTLAIIQKIWDFRAESQLPLCFTLDAGANVHLLYPKKDCISVMDFIKNELCGFCQNGEYIEDQVGNGPLKI